jgi:hypothetical protein
MRSGTDVRSKINEKAMSGMLTAAMLGVLVASAAGCGRANAGAGVTSPSDGVTSASAAGATSGTAGTVPSKAEAGKAETAANARKEARAAMDEERTELEQVPPPTKSHYLIVQTASAWQNPFIVVGTDKLKVEVMMGDANPLPGAGGLLRPAAARRNIIEIKTADLGKMLSALPTNAWPYGRVVAVEESQQTARQDRIEMRRNMESTLQTLNSLGVVIHEWSEPAGR